MILLLGGTSETGPLASALLGRGLEVLVSTATDAPLALPEGVRRRWGRLDGAALAELCCREGISALVDAGHPFATELHAAVQEAARLTGLPLLRFRRGETRLGDESVHWVTDHEEAARVAFSFGRPVLLTSGSRHLEPYVRASRETGLPVYARVLDHPESWRSCQEAGLDRACVMAMRGPFDLETNRAHLRHTGAGVLVSKDSGEAGGLGAKAEACRLEGVLLVLLRRPNGAGDASDPEVLADLVILATHQRS
ncbi:precorrin-6A reductase [Holophaga foetida]|uniref:precorrin-6A reductase n=1 Tax=Holophaga foetida TaxID=35839 RepID=UPI0002471CEC|nr:precorrin-6A reductase [Holophaga foetida]